MTSFDKLPVREPLSRHCHDGATTAAYFPLRCSRLCCLQTRRASCCTLAHERALYFQELVTSAVSTRFVQPDSLSCCLVRRKAELN